MFGRKNIGDSVPPEFRQKLVDGYRAVLVEVDDVIERCTWFLDETRRTDIPPEFVAPLQQMLEEETAIREHVARRVETIPTAPLVIAELGEEMNSINRATVAADDLMRRAGADAAMAIMLQGLAKKS